jgi:hypothetical protein
MAAFCFRCNASPLFEIALCVRSFCQSPTRAKSVRRLPPELHLTSFRQGKTASEGSFTQPKKTFRNFAQRFPKENRMIQDDLTGRTDVSRQYFHQVRKRRRGICAICTRPSAATSACFCAEHYKITRERQRNRIGCKRRY